MKIITEPHDEEILPWRDPIFLSLSRYAINITTLYTRSSKHLYTEKFYVNDK